VGILNNTLRWGSDAGLSLLAVNAGRIMHNTITQNGCGVYLTTKFEHQTSNDLLIANNTFRDIDPENFYHNSDTHAIGIQGGLRNVYEHNRIDRVGGSGLTFFQWHNVSMSHSVVRFNVISNVWNDDQANYHKLQRGIEFDSGDVNISRCTNNTVSYNVLQNIGTSAFRSKATVNPTAENKYSWRWLNNIVVNASVSFETRYTASIPSMIPHGDLVANNLFVSPRVHHQDGVIPGNSSKDTDRFENNAFWPPRGTPASAAAALFCFGGSDSPIDAKNWTRNCLSFAGWAARFPKAMLDASTMVLVNPEMGGGDALPAAALPTSKALASAGKALPYEVVRARTDIAGRPLRSPPSIGAFQIALLESGLEVVHSWPWKSDDDDSSSPFGEGAHMHEPQFHVIAPQFPGLNGSTWPGGVNDANAVFGHNGVFHIMHQVRKTPRQVGPEVGPTSAVYSCIPTGMHGP
jgi:hypothetical protein